MPPIERWAGARVLANYISAEGVKVALENALNDPDQRVSSAAARALKTLEKK